jgi:hypothetical protein
MGPVLCGAATAVPIKRLRSLAAIEGGMMAKLGMTLVLLGVGSFVLPLVGLQFRVLSLFGENQAIAAIGMVVVGGLMLAAGSRGAASAS